MQKIKIAIEKLRAYRIIGEVRSFGAKLVQIPLLRAVTKASFSRLSNYVLNFSKEGTQQPL